MLDLPFYVYGYFGLGIWLMIVVAIFYAENSDG